MPEPLVMLSCEHAVNQVPDALRILFEDQEEVLDSHRAYDAGALCLAEELAQQFDAPLFRSHVTRLLIDHNRSPYNRGLWSEFSRDLEPADRRFLIEKHYLPFRARVATWLAEHVAKSRPVIHLSIHSFTPVLNGQVRRTDIGLLYDPARAEETALARAWQQELQRCEPDLCAQRNRPYRGTSDCHQQTYRKLYPAAQYLALELEVNQKLLGSGHGGWAGLRRAIGSSLQDVLGGEW